MKQKIYKRSPYSQKLGKIYFWTASIHKWKNLLYFPEQKEMIINSLQFLSEKNLVTIYAYVIMPNHIYIIWKQNKLNGKEMPRSSFMKHTARELLKKVCDKGKVHQHKVRAANKAHQIWKPNSIAIELYSKRFIKQKLDYMHKNPVRGKRVLYKYDTENPYSSAQFYQNGEGRVNFLNNIFDVIGGPKRNEENYDTLLYKKDGFK